MLQSATGSLVLKTIVQLPIFKCFQMFYRIIPSFSTDFKTSVYPSKEATQFSFLFSGTDKSRIHC